MNNLSSKQLSQFRRPRTRAMGRVQKRGHIFVIQPRRQQPPSLLLCTQLYKKSSEGWTAILTTLCVACRILAQSTVPCVTSRNLRAFTETTTQTSSHITLHIMAKRSPIERSMTKDPFFATMKVHPPFQICWNMIPLTRQECQLICALSLYVLFEDGTPLDDTTISGVIEAHSGLPKIDCTDLVSFLKRKKMLYPQVKAESREWAPRARKAYNLWQDRWAPLIDSWP